MAQDNRRYLDALYRLFQHFALEDQRKYYTKAVRRYRKAAEQVNRYRALFGLLTGLASATAGLLVAGYLAPGAFANNGECAALSAPSALIQETDAQSAEAQRETVGERPLYCRAMESFIVVLTIVSIIAPAVAAGFTTLADLYQWDRLTSIYETALENMEVADAQSPPPNMPELEFRASLRAFAEGALSVMRDETAQWGQASAAPPQLEKFIEEERRKLGLRGDTPDAPGGG